VHSNKILDLVEREAARAGKKQRVLLQVNISSDEKKSGFGAEEIGALWPELSTGHPSLAVEGLMTITAFYEDTELVRPDFKKMMELAQALSGAKPLPRLSMGMSADFEVAIEEGATHVRVGTAIFGERQ
jgi:hypothetical protein